MSMSKAELHIGAHSFDAIVLPKDSDLSLVIKLLNDMQMSFTDKDKRQGFWKPYIKTIHVPEPTS